MNFQQVKAIQAKNEAKIRILNPNISAASGIYVFTRTDENDFKFCYVGQAKNLLERTAQHLSGYQWIDLSLKKHGLYSETNPHGYMLGFFTVDAENLDKQEQQTIADYAKLGYQLRNATTGGQGDGKRSISDYGRSGYLQGKRDGYEKAYKEIGAQVIKYMNLTSKGGAIADRKTAELIDKIRGDLCRNEQNYGGTD